MAVFKVKTEQLSQFGVTMYAEVLEDAGYAVDMFAEGVPVEPQRDWTAHIQYGPKKSDPSQTVAKKVIKLEAA